MVVQSLFVRIVNPPLVEVVAVVDLETTIVEEEAVEVAMTTITLDTATTTTVAPVEISCRVPPLNKDVNFTWEISPGEPDGAISKITLVNVEVSIVPRWQRVQMDGRRGSV